MPNKKGASHVRSGMIILVGTILGQGIGYFYNVYLARAAGKFGYGQINQLISLSTLFASITQIGLNRAAIRFSAVHFNREEGGQLKGVLLLTYGAVGLASLLLGIVGVSVSRLLAVQYLQDAALWIPVVIAIGLGTLTALFNITMELLRGVGNATHRTYIEGLLQKVLRLGILAGAPRPPGLVFVMVAELATMGTGLALGLGSLWRQVHRMLAGVRAELRHSDLWRFTMPLIPAAVASALTLQAETVLLGWSGQTTEVAVFNAALRTAAVGEILFTAFYTNFAPAVSALRDTGRTEELVTLFRQYTLWVSVLVSVWAGAMIIASPELLQLFGADYRSGASVLVLLCVSKVVAALFGPVGLMVTMAGHGMLTLLNSVLWLAGSYLFGLLLIPSMGATGAAISFTVALLIGHLAPTRQVWMLYRTVGTSWRAILMAASAVGAGLGVVWWRGRSSPFASSLPGAVMAEAVFMVLMAGLVWACLTAGERAQLSSFAGRILRRARRTRTG